MRRSGQGKHLFFGKSLQINVRVFFPYHHKVLYIQSQVKQHILFWPFFRPILKEKATFNLPSTFLLFIGKHELARVMLTDILIFFLQIDHLFYILEAMSMYLLRAESPAVAPGLALLLTSP